MKCKRCGNTIEDDSEFCYFCGWDFDEDTLEEKSEEQIEAELADYNSDDHTEYVDDFDFDLHGENYQYNILGNRGRRIVVYTNKAVIKTSVSFGSLVTHNATDGEKTIFFKDVIGVQFKQPGITIGFLQLETASGLGNNDKNNFFNENTFTFSENVLPETYEAYRYILRQLEKVKAFPGT